MSILYFRWHEPRNIYGDWILYVGDNPRYVAAVSFFKNTKGPKFLVSYNIPITNRYLDIEDPTIKTLDQAKAAVEKEISDWFSTFLKDSNLIQALTDLYYSTGWMDLAKVAPPTDGIARFNQGSLVAERLFRELNIDPKEYKVTRNN